MSKRLPLEDLEEEMSGFVWQSLGSEDGEILISPEKGTRSSPSDVAGNV